MTAEPRKYDLTIIGSGPGGYVAAIRAGQLGLRVAVIEEFPEPGGTCLHWGCIPTKALLHSAEVLETTRHAAEFGIKTIEGEIDHDGVAAYMSRVIDGNAKGIRYLFKKNKVDLLPGRGRLSGPGVVEVTSADGSVTRVESSKIIVATGSSVRGLPGIEFDGERILNSDHVLRLGRVPKSMIVMGAGAVGVEFASIYHSFGADVTIVELMDRLLPVEDEALGKELQRAFKKRRIGVHTGTRVETVERHKDLVRLTATKNDKPVTFEAEVLLIAVGRKPRTEEIGLETTAAVLDRGFIEVDPATMLTAEAGVYAIGDIIKGPALAHLASHEGIVAAEHAAGLSPHPIDYDKIPSCTYCSPEVASIGLTEEEAKRRGYEVVIGKFPFSAIGKAKIVGDTRGFVKIVTDKKYDEVLGVHIIGPCATELISEATAALNLEATAESLFQAIHAHPTLAEAMGEAALAVHGREIHI